MVMVLLIMLCSTLLSLRKLLPPITSVWRCERTNALKLTCQLFLLKFSLISPIDFKIVLSSASFANCKFGNIFQPISFVKSALTHETQQPESKSICTILLS